MSLTPSPSPSISVSPSPTATDGLSGLLSSAPGRLLGTTDTIKCERDDVTVCGITVKLTGNKGLGEVLQIILGTPLRLVLIIVLAIVIRRLLHRLIDRLANRIATGGAVASPVQDGPAAPPRAGHTSLLLATRREARARTIASLLRSVTTALVSVIAGLMVLQELQFSVTPLLASAGVAGVALGFGCQSLVRDIVSGMFMIVEDQYGVGDVVDLGEASGTVEAVGLRVTRLRDVNGTVWYVRNGEVVRVGNQSQGWSRAVLDVNVGYHEDISRVEATLFDIAQELRTEPEYRALTIGEPQVWGVEALTTDGVVVRLVVKARPLQQWTIARELRRRIKIRFEQEGIEMYPAPPTVVMDGEDGGEQTQAATSGGSPAAAAPE